MGDVGDWQTDAQAVAGYMETALRSRRHCLPPSRSSIPACSPLRTDTADHFGGPTYNKGGSLLRMIRGMLGETTFQTACQQFLATYRFSTAYASDLFAAFAAQMPDADSAAMMRDALGVWGNKRGFPLVRVSDVTPASGATSRVWQVRQQQYKLEDEGATWPVWLQYSVVSAGGVRSVGAVWLNASNGYAVTLQTPLDSAYVTLNYNRTSFYRVQYEPASVYEELRVALANNMTRDQVTLQDRIGLLADAYWTQVDGYLGSWPAVVNSTLRILAREHDYPVWAGGLTVLNDLWGRLRLAVRNDTDAEGHRMLRSYMHMLVEHAAETVGWEVDTRQHQDTHLNGMMQVAFGPLACRFDARPCLDAASRLYAGWKNSSMSASALPTANMRAVSLGYGARLAGEASGLIVQYLTNSPTQQHATLYLEGAMVAARSSDIAQLTQYLVTIANSSAASDALRYSDTVWSVVQRLSQLNEAAVPTMLAEFTQSPASFDALILPYDYSAPNSSRAAFTTLVNTLVGGIQAQKDLDEVRSKLFTADRYGAMTDAGRSAVDAAYVSAQSNIDWASNNWPSIKQAMQGALQSEGRTW